MSNLVKVDFHGQQIDCINNEEGVSVALRRMCDNIGLDYSGQLQKLKEKPWACVGLISTHDSSGRQQEMVMLNLDAVPMWLATIDSGRVSEDVRPKIELYQLECAKVLRDYWFKGEAVNPRKDSKRDEAMLLNAKNRQSKTFLEIINRINELTPLDKSVMSTMNAIAAEMVSDRPLNQLKPSVSDDWLSPEQIATAFGLTSQRIGLTVSALQIRGNIEGICRAVLNKATNSDKTVTSYQYSPKAVEMIRSKLIADGHLREISA